jgi:hypothetical protein
MYNWSTRKAGTKDTFVYPFCNFRRWLALTRHAVIETTPVSYDGKPHDVKKNILKGVRKPRKVPLDKYILRDDDGWATGIALPLPEKAKRRWSYLRGVLSDYHNLLWFPGAVTRLRGPAIRVDPDALWVAP